MEKGDHEVSFGEATEDHRHEIIREVELKTNITAYLYFVVITVALGGFTNGYDVGILSSAILMLEKDFVLTTVQKGIIVGITNAGGFFGGIIAGYIADVVGRKSTAFLNAIFFFTGYVLSSFSTAFPSLLICRFTVGFAGGISSMIIPTYISEISPVFHRGELVTWNNLMYTAAQTIAILVSIIFSSVGDWSLSEDLTGQGRNLSILYIGLFLVPESPRFLIKNGKNEEAVVILQEIYPNSSREFLEDEIKVIHQAVVEDNKGSYKLLLKYPYRRPLLIACGLLIIQELAGYDTLMYYAATIIKIIGFAATTTAIIYSLAISVSSFIMLMVSKYWIDRIGRRKILLSSIAGTIIGLILLSIGFSFITGFVTKQSSCINYEKVCGACVLDDRCMFSNSNGGICVDKNSTVSVTYGTYDICMENHKARAWFTLCAFTLFSMMYSLGFGNITWLIQSEIYPLNIRGRATGIGAAANWGMTAIVSMIFLPLAEVITIPGILLLFALFSLLGLIFVYRFLPETVGKSLEEIQDYFVSPILCYMSTSIKDANTLMRTERPES
ncbi:8738_t:CDS:10 [Acaulospora morrowiae]|uniref:8738_t:CDS:1 n=1 Tax=Acaulospora morrowiae TaxID=94023 RepID=A0A9N9C9A6_9GLOM|nr:8738_t:CDS:10 [Acaulospora morrowiae]